MESASEEKERGASENAKLEDGGGREGRSRKGCYAAIHTRALLLGLIRGVDNRGYSLQEVRCELVVVSYPYRTHVTNSLSVTTLLDLSSCRTKRFCN